MNNWHSVNTVEWSLVGSLARQISWPWTEDNTVGHHSYLMLEWMIYRRFSDNDRHLEQRTALLATTICYLMWVIMNDTWLITGFVTRLTRGGPLVEQELLTRPEHLSLPPVFSGARVTWSLVLCICFVDRCLSFWPLCCLFFDIRILISLWYLQTLLKSWYTSWRGQHCWPQLFVT